MKSEPKYRKQLDRNGWMARLQHWLWEGNEPKFSGYCPFFWFTWLTLLISPLGLIFFGARGILRLVASGWDKYAPTPRPSDRLLVAFWEDVQNVGLATAFDLWDGNYYGVSKWVRATPCWKDCVVRALAKRDHREAKAAAKAPINKARVAKMAGIAKWVVYPIIGTAVCIASWFLGKWFVLGLIFLFTHITWPGLKDFAQAIGAILGVAIVMYLVILGAGKLWSLRRKCPRDPEHIPWYSKILGPLGAGFQFLFDTVESIYTSECPLIEWSDSSAPIRRAKR